ncbi:hypothetical protein pdam_00025103 [Pocillopora damicornis]|uniref:Uncharacterized protein n=1 Tax=Pocillopora damicornis TaxID=46731 RepID=A0A3M6UM01_POCDA|nr:hypothetical protein pdam_00025103 [Pocillopora damicornis]
MFCKSLNIPSQSLSTEVVLVDGILMLTVSKNCLVEAINAVEMLNFSTKIKLKLYQSCVLSTPSIALNFGNDRRGSFQAVSLPHKKPEKSHEDVLAKRHLRQPTTC